MNSFYDLEERGQYYIERTPTTTPKYEENYWGTVEDPDGNVRDRSKEREQYLDDYKEELDFVNSLPPGRICDVGCGVGFFLSGVNDEWEKSGVEVSRHAYKYILDHKPYKGSVFCGMLEVAEYEPRSLDVVTLLHVIEHVGDPLSLIDEIGWILKDDGWLILSTPDFDSPVARRFGDNFRLLHDPTHVSLFSRDSMTRMLRDYGFKIRNVTTPFFNQRHFTEENLLRLLDTTKVSPPAYGNVITVYAQK